MRLIDADKLVKDRVPNDPVVIAAKCQLTIYDVDKVMRQLEKMAIGIPTIRGINMAVSLNTAIEIVKCGGING